MFMCHLYKETAIWKDHISTFFQVNELSATESCVIDTGERLAGIAAS